MLKKTVLLVFVVLLPVCALAAETVRRRALLVGINDYSAAKLPPSKARPGAARDWSDLDGAVNDVELMREVLVKCYGFAAADIDVLVNHQATREAILRALERLAKESRPGDIVFVHYSGHGSQVRNSKSAEHDHLDESLVPADSRRGVLDIRDKELRDAFNRILDQGARLTAAIDACHSGSVGRGLNAGARPRAVSPDTRDVADASTALAPEDRGALILSAAQEFELAYEIKDPDGTIRGAFSWALAQAMRDADRGEAAADTFLRAQARLHNDRAGQDPVIAGKPEVRLRLFLGGGDDLAARRNVIAIQSVTAKGTYILDGGWANGLAAGSKLRLAGHPDVSLEVMSLVGISQAEARAAGAPARVARLEPGALLEIAAWAPPPGRPLRVWIPRTSGDVRTMAEALAREAARRGIVCVDDPTETTPAALLRWRERRWEILTAGRRKWAGAKPLGAVPPTASLFIELPASAQLVEAIGSVDGVELISAPESADYILVGRAAPGGLEYAWLRPQALAGDDAHNALPARTAWTPIGPETAPQLREFLQKLRLVHGWHDLTSPAGAASVYRLGVRGDDGALVDDAPLVGGRQVHLVLRARNGGEAAPVYARFVYVFMIDSAANGVLLFPSEENGSVENRLPLTQNAGEPVPDPPEEIALVTREPVTIVEPYGTDTYFLLSTDEPLTSLGRLSWKGVTRSVETASRNPLAELLASVAAGTRGDGAPITTPPNWTIDKVVFRSVAPPRSTP